MAFAAATLGEVGLAVRRPAADGPSREGYGLGLPGVYAVWLLVVALLYPLCRWFAALKRRRRDRVAELPVIPS